MASWTEILDHGDDPGRYTLIDGRGNVITCNENGSVIAKRKCKNPYGVVTELCRDPNIRIVKPALQVELLKKIYRFISLHANDDPNTRPLDHRNDQSQ